MRQYAALYDFGTKSNIIMYRDNTDPPDRWFVMEKDISNDNVETLVDALNKSEN